MSLKNCYNFNDFRRLAKKKLPSQIFKYIDGDISLDEAIDLIKLNTRKYSKRQMTWFRRNKEILWYKDGEGYFQDILDDLRF